MFNLRNIQLLLLPALFGSLLVLSACNKDDDDNEPENEQEVITTVTLTFVDSDNISTVFQAADPDGDGGNPPTIDDITLDADETYRLSVAFLDESNPGDVENITEEVEEESNEHLVCFDATGFAIGPDPEDTDDNGDPLGLVSNLATGNAGSGSLTVTLKHEPDKSAANPCSTGETDVEVTFPVTIQ